VTRVPDSELDYDADLVFTHHGVPYTGIGYDEDAVCGVSEISYVDGRQEGPSRDWYPSGQLKAEVMYRNNVRHGYTREFTEDGVLSREELYDYGVRTQSIVFDAAGTEISVYRMPADDKRWNELRELHEETDD